MIKLEFLDSLDFEWIDGWAEIDKDFYCSGVEYDVAFESYIHSYWNYLGEVAR